MEEEHSLPKRYGFVNIGNTCYMNAGLQMLRSVPQFKDIVHGISQAQVRLNSNSAKQPKQSSCFHSEKRYCRTGC